MPLCSQYTRALTSSERSHTQQARILFEQALSMNADDGDSLGACALFLDMCVCVCVCVCVCIHICICICIFINKKKILIMLQLYMNI